jgi:hypothetical protein
VPTISGRVSAGRRLLKDSFTGILSIQFFVMLVKTSANLGFIELFAHAGSILLPRRRSALLIADLRSKYERLTWARAAASSINFFSSSLNKPPTQDRRRLSRYMRRWLVERFFGLDTAEYSSAGNSTLRTSSALSSSLASLSSSDNFEIGSSDSAIYFLVRSISN